MERLIGDFFKLVGSHDIEIYNEFSLQHELGIFLRKIMTDKMFDRFILLISD